MSADLNEIREVRRRVLTHYFPAWCAARESRNASEFNPDWSFLTPNLAHWFLRAIDEQVVEVRDGSPWFQDSSGSWLFENNKPRLYREGFLEVAAAAMLAGRFGWSPERLTFQSPPVPGSSRLWAFDLLAYAGDGETGEVAIAGEAKWKQSDAIKLRVGLEACGSQGGHSEESCKQPTNHHRKYQGLLDYQPRLLWIIGPHAFSGTPDLVFRVKQGAGGFVELEPAAATELDARTGL